MFECDTYWPLGRFHRSKSQHRVSNPCLSKLYQFYFPIEVTFHRPNVFQNYNETLNHADNLAPKTTKTDISLRHTLQIAHELVGITMVVLSLPLNITDSMWKQPNYCQVTERRINDPTLQFAWTQTSFEKWDAILKHGVWHFNCHRTWLEFHLSSEQHSIW